MARNANNVPSAANNNRVEQPTFKGNNAARVVQIVFVGVQDQRPFQGQPKPPVDTVRVTYEMSHIFMLDEDGKELADKPRWITEDFPFYSLDADLAKSTKRYYAIDPDDNSEGDWGALLGLPVTITAVTNKGKGKNADKEYTNIGGVSPAMVMPGYVQPELVNPAFYFDPQDNEVSVEAFNSLPDFIQEIIKGAHDFSTSALAKALAGGGVSEPSNDRAPAQTQAPVRDEAGTTGQNDAPLY